MSILLPYQARWWADTSPVKVAEKSRQIGLTWTTSGRAAYDAGCRGTRGCNTWYISYTETFAQEFILDAAWWARRFGVMIAPVQEYILDDGDRGILSFSIKAATGHRIVALSSKPRNLRGKDGNLVIDEAAHHDDLEGLMKAALAAMFWGGRITVISTHEGVGNYFNTLVKDIRAGRKNYSLHSIDFDEALKDGLYRRICLKDNEVWTPEKEQVWRQDIIDGYHPHSDEELFCKPRTPGQRGFFDRDWFRVVSAIPDDIVAVVRGWDLAGTERSKKNKDPDYTRCVKIGKRRNGQLVVMDGGGIQGNPGQVDNLILGMAALDGKEATQAFWQDPGQAGKDQARMKRKLLSGYSCVFKPATKDKITYAGPFSSIAHAGRDDLDKQVLVVEGRWVESWFNELESFPDGHDDWVDATSRAEIGLRNRGGGTLNVELGGTQMERP